MMMMMMMTMMMMMMMMTMTMMMIMMAGKEDYNIVMWMDHRAEKEAASTNNIQHS